MIDINYREFWRNFGKYKGSLEMIQVIGRGGVIYGTYVPAGAEWKAGEIFRKEEDEEGVPDVEGNTFAELRKKFDNRMERGVEEIVSDDPEEAGNVKRIMESFEEAEEKPRCDFCIRAGRKEPLIAERKVDWQWEAEGYEKHFVCCLCFKGLGVPGEKI